MDVRWQGQTTAKPATRVGILLSRQAAAGFDPRRRFARDRPALRNKNTPTLLDYPRTNAHRRPRCVVSGPQWREGVLLLLAARPERAFPFQKRASHRHVDRRGKLTNKNLL